MLRTTTYYSAALLALAVTSCGSRLLDPEADIKSEITRLGGKCDLYEEFTKPVSHVSLGGPALHDGNVTLLTGLTKPRGLILQDSAITDASLPVLAKMKTVAWLNLEGAGVTDTGLKHLTGMSLEKLDIGRTRVTDTGMDEIAKIKTLGALSLNWTRVTDAGIEKLKGLPLYQLYVYDTRISGSGISKLKGLHTLYASRCPVDDAAIAIIAAECKNLDTLYLNETKITDAGARELIRLDKLSSLDLCECAIGDDTIKAIAGLKWLRSLSVSNTKVTAAGLRHLEPLEKLTLVNASGLTITAAEFDELEKRMPNTTFTR